MNTFNLDDEKNYEMHLNCLANILNLNSTNMLLVKFELCLEYLKKSNLKHEDIINMIHIINTCKIPSKGGYQQYGKTAYIDDDTLDVIYGILTMCKINGKRNN